MKKISLALVALVTLASAPYAAACARGHCRQLVQAAGWPPGDPNQDAVDPNAETVELPARNVVDPDAETVELPVQRAYRSSEDGQSRVKVCFRGVALMAEDQSDGGFQLAGLTAEAMPDQDAHNGEFILVGKPYDLIDIHLALDGDVVTGLWAHIVEGDQIRGDLRLKIVTKTYGATEVTAASGRFHLKGDARGRLVGKIRVDYEKADDPRLDGAMRAF